ncbi:MAG: hypothetical protein AAFR93_12290 [Pseudomonadota bacterium]
MIYLTLYLAALALFSLLVLRHMARKQRRVMRLNNYYSTDASRSRAHAEPRFQRREAVADANLARAVRIREVGQAQAGLLRLEHPMTRAEGLRQSA